MKLLQIKFSGFKSFADTTAINIKGNLVGIVGPNGCGKSNVMDAVRWVLGESSAKQLRGESMQDVIFNGSTSRNPVSRATVELVFDNSAKTLPGLWNRYSEISIKRLLSRQGESIYYINNQVVRRRDITDLFLGTGVGSKGYAVIEQGMISRIIESKPEELRLYLEEAAGVSKYREKRKETLNRLQDTRDNLLRLEDIQGELSKQIEYLAQQAQTAKHYQQLQAQLKQKQLLQVLIKMSKAETTLNEIKCNIANHESALAENSAKLELVDAELINRSAEKVQQELHLAKLTSQFNLLRTNLARLEERRRHGLELAERLAKDKYEFTEQLDDIHTHILELKQLTEEVTQEITANRLIIEEKQLIKEQKTVDFEAIEALYIKAGDMLTECGNEVNGVRRELDLLNNTLTHKKSQSSNLTTRLKRLEQEGAPNSLDFNQNYFELKDEMSELAMELEELTLELTDSKEQLATVIASKAEQHEQIQVNKANVSVINSQLATLNELLSQQSHQQDLTQVFDQIQLSAPLWHYIQVSPGYELAVEAVLADLLSARIIEDLNLLTAMPEQKLALWFSGSSSVTPKPGSLATYVVINNNKLLGLHAILNEYQIVETLEAALPQDGAKLVTRDGHILTANYVVFNANAGQTNVLEYQNKLLVLEGELAA
ncbi:MAG: chromosome segregation SMC family protein, partial [Burkholderiales bacterium]